jgi:hypothetical protein
VLQGCGAATFRAMCFAPQLEELFGCTLLWNASVSNQAVSLSQDTAMSKLWFKQDDKFFLPKACLNFEFFRYVIESSQTT